MEHVANESASVQENYQSIPEAIEDPTTPRRTSRSAARIAVNTIVAVILSVSILSAVVGHFSPVSKFRWERNNVNEWNGVEQSVKLDLKNLDGSGK